MPHLGECGEGITNPTGYHALFNSIQQQRDTTLPCPRVNTSQFHSQAVKLTSNSHSALKTFSSKLGSTKLDTSLRMVDSVSFRSTVIGMLSRRLDVDDLPSESELDLGGGDDCFPCAEMNAGVVADSCRNDRLPGWRPYGVWPGLLGSEWSVESHTDGE